VGKSGEIFFFKHETKKTTFYW